MTDARCEPPPELRGKDGLHWVQYRDDEPQEARWQHEGIWRMGREIIRAEGAYVLGYRYLSPVLTPAEVAALRAERDAAVAAHGKTGLLLEKYVLEAHALRAEVEKLKRALKAADQFITNGIELGFIRMPDPSTPDPALETPGIIRAALKETAP